jgi:hypothetical protein
LVTFYLSEGAGIQSSDQIKNSPGSNLGGIGPAGKRNYHIRLAKVRQFVKS